MTATPSAPPTWRVVSFTAEPTPALPRGNEPMIDSVAGAMVSAMPLAINAWRQMMSGQYGLVALSEAHEIRPPVTISRPGADDELGADPMDEARAQRRQDHHARGDRQEADTGLQRRVAEHELEVLREQERRAEHGEEHHHDAHAGGGEPRVLEEPARRASGGRCAPPTTRNAPSTITPSAKPASVALLPQPFWGASMMP